jgi:RimJ/RimL family protein N-acetyltransferase
MLPIRQISKHELDKYETHLIRLSDDSRRLRFTYPASDEAISKFIATVRDNYDKHKIFTVEDDTLNIVGVAHISLQEELMELAFSVNDNMQGQGLGTELIKYSINWCRNRSISKGYMVCLSTNSKMKKLAVKCGMKLQTEYGETTAAIELDAPTPLTYTTELMTSNLAMYDHIVKTTRKLATDSIQSLIFTY